MLLVGTSGWVYKHWREVFYPPGLPARGFLPFYAERFPTVEVNFSFYRLPERSVFEAWGAQTPPDFLFAVKGSRYITHMKKLNDPEEPLRRLMERVAGLGEKLGPILFQFPPWWAADVARLRGFVDRLGAYAPQRFAFEFRHASWLAPTIYELLERAGAALCLPVGPGVPVDVRLTAPWTYVRFHSGQHGTGYADDELRAWADRIGAFLARETDVYAYFNNDPGGHAIRDAGRLCALLGVPRSASVVATW